MNKKSVMYCAVAVSIVYCCPLLGGMDINYDSGAWKILKQIRDNTLNLEERIQTLEKMITVIERAVTKISCQHCYKIRKNTSFITLKCGHCYCKQCLWKNVDREIEAALERGVWSHAFRYAQCSDCKSKIKVSDIKRITKFPSKVKEIVRLRKQKELLDKDYPQSTGYDEANFF